MQRQEIGHVLPASMWLSLALVSMCYNHPGAQLRLLRQEGRLMVFEGCLFLVYFSIAHNGGGIMEVLVQRHKDEITNMKDQQHTFAAVVWVACGILAFCQYSRRIVLGVPVALAMISQAAMIMYHKHQQSPLAATAHLIHGYLIGAAGLIRLTGHQPAFTLVTVLASFSFIASSDCLTAWAASSGWDSMAYMLFVCSLGVCVWAFHLVLFTQTTDSDDAEKGYYIPPALAKQLGKASRNFSGVKVLSPEELQ
eukprot:scaffold2157_cov376-Prasinococcus_capsulatus_cf.AAC.3